MMWTQLAEDASLERREFFGTPTITSVSRNFLVSHGLSSFLHFPAWNHHHDRFNT